MGHILILLCDSPFQHESVEHAINLSKAAMNKGHSVDIYLMMDGVYNTLITQSGKPFHIESISNRFKELLELGASISGCRVCMELRGISRENIPNGVELGGIFNLGEMISKADVILSMTGVI